MTSVLPPPEQAALHAISRGSVVYRYASDSRTMLGAGAALLLQVAHPTVGAGVREHSDFLADPWGRLLRTLDYVNLLVYGTPEQAAETARRVRDMHKQIKGVAKDGTRYHALDPEAYAWVHATLAEVIVAAHERFGRRLDRGQVEEFWREWRELGRLLGIRERDLPPTWAAFRFYVDEMIDTRLEHNETVDLVRYALSRPAAPPLPSAAQTPWKLVSVPAAKATELATAGLLPARLRDKLGIPWSRWDEAQLRALGAATRPATPLMPRSMRRMGPAWLRWREREIAHGQFGSAAA
jgi:uncharacterized protein (DUF2236 family)